MKEIKNIADNIILKSQQNIFTDLVYSISSLHINKQINEYYYTMCNNKESF